MNVEKAYQVIATCAQLEAGSLSWDFLTVESKNFFKMAEIIHWVNQGGKRMQSNGAIDFDMSMKQLESILLIRDNLIETTGQRIWGLTFTLWPNGKFNLEYDYNKPDDYDDTDELISGDEINKSIDGLKN